MAGIKEFIGETLVGKDGNVTTIDACSGKTVGLYFSAHWCPPCRGFTPKLASTYDAVVKAGKPLEIVFVSGDRDEASFNDYYGEMPWKALPFEDRARQESLSKKYKVSGIPSLVFVDGDTGDVVNEKGRDVIASDPSGDNFPWTPKTRAECIGDSFVGKDGATVPFADVQGKHLLIYFSAHWCPPCRNFTPKLIQTYKKLKDRGVEFEVVFVSSDRSEEQFNEYYGEMPWLAVPFDDKGRKADLNSHFEVEGIPTLIVLDPELNLITSEGTEGVGADADGLEFPWHPKPVNDVDDSSSGINDYPSAVVFMEGGDDDVHEETIKALSEAHAPYADRDEPPYKFFYCKSKDGLAARLRSLCGLSSPNMGDDPILVLIDIPDNGGFYVHKFEEGEDDIITGGVISKFFAAYDAKELERKQLDF